MAIRFACACGRQLKVRDDRAEQRMRCPDCSTLVTIPGQSEEGELPDLVKGTSRPGRKSTCAVDDLEDLVPSLWPRMAEALNPWVDRSLEQRVTPWQKDDEKRQAAREAQPVRRVFFWAVVLLLVVLTGIGVAAWYSWPFD